MRRPAFSALALACGLAPAAGRAQDPGSSLGAAATVDAGVARVQQAGTPGLTAPSVGAGVALGRGPAEVRLAGAVAAADGRGASLLEAAAERVVGRVGAGGVRVDAELRGARVPNTPWAVLALAGLRADVPLGARGVFGDAAAGAWARVQAGASRQAGGDSPSAAAEAGVWHAAGPGGRVALTVGGAAARVTERGLVAAGFDVRGPVSVTTGEAALAWERATAEWALALRAGGRAYLPRGLRALPADDEDPRLPGPPLRWRAQASAAGVAWVAPALGITAAAGLAPNDPVRGLPAAAYLTAGLRLRARTAGRAAGRAGEGGVAGGPAVRRVPGGGDADAVTVSALTAAGAEGAAGAPRAVAVRAPAAARRVELRGDATGWQAVVLARGSDGGWTAALALAAGSHRVQVRVDDGPWRAPANLPALADELVGDVGLLVVP